MLVYILVGVGSGLLFLAFVIGLFSWLYVRRRNRNRISRTKETSSSRRPFRIRSKGNGPTMPAIHDMIFNGLVSDGDRGFSNRAISDPKVFQAEYGIPVDFTDCTTDNSP